MQTGTHDDTTRQSRDVGTVEARQVATPIRATVCARSRAETQASIRRPFARPEGGIRRDREYALQVRTGYNLELVGTYTGRC
jgi:hypothetical protein